MAVVQATCGYGCGLNSLAFVEAYLADEPDLWWARTDVCRDFADALLAAVDAKARPGDVVATITAHYKFAHAGGFDGAFVAALRDRVRSKGASFLLLGDGPYLNDFGFNCKTEETRRNCDTTRADARPDLFDDAEAFYADLARDDPGTWFFPVFDLLCDGDACGALVPGTATVAVTDKGHWTTAASLYLAPFLHCFLRDAGILPADDDRPRPPPPNCR